MNSHEIHFFSTSAYGKGLSSFACHCANSRGTGKVGKIGGKEEAARRKDDYENAPVQRRRNLHDERHWLRSHRRRVYLSRYKAMLMALQVSFLIAMDGCILSSRRSFHRRSARSTLVCPVSNHFNCFRFSVVHRTELREQCGPRQSDNRKRAVILQFHTIYRPACSLSYKIK